MGRKKILGDGVIFDRTEQDVVLAKEIRETKIKNFIPLSVSEEEVLERGSILPSTLNRISSKQTELARTVVSLGYYGAGAKIVDLGEFSEDSVFFKNQLEKMVKNSERIRDNFPSAPDAPPYISPRYHWRDFNGIEKILYDAEVNALYIEENSLECDTFFCGE